MAVLVRTLAVALAVVLALAGCAQRIDGRAAMGPRDVDQSFFFAGDVPTYGRTLSADETITLAYLRAIRRIDVCGLVTQDTLSSVGEIASYGTPLSFTECGVIVKVSGSTRRMLVSVELFMSAPSETGSAGCESIFPLDLSRLPGAQPLPQGEQPFVNVTLGGTQDCAVVRTISDALAQRIATVPLPPRDAVATYPMWLAEQDPCEVLAVLGDRVDNWQVEGLAPYQCRFGVDGSALRLRLGPVVVQLATEGYVRRDQDGIEVYVHPVFCSAVAFVGPAMQRKLVGGGYADGELEIGRQ